MIEDVLKCINIFWCCLWENLQENLCI